MDIHTGEVLAMTSLPQLNPNAAGQGSPEARFNRATLGVYELGSTFKPFTVAMAMDSGIIKSFGQMYNCPQRAARLRPHRSTTRTPSAAPCSVAEIMKESSNIGTAQIADQLGADAAEGVPRARWASSTRSQIELKERGADADAGLATGARSRR